MKCGEHRADCECKPPLPAKKPKVKILTEEKRLGKFLKWVDEKTTFFEDKDVTISQVVDEYLNTIRK